MDQPRRIACFHLNQVGDLLFSLPAIYNLRSHYPEAEIISVARPYLKDLIRMSGLVDRVIERRRRPIGTGFELAAALRHEKPDMAVVFSTSFGMSVLAGLSGAKTRVGFDGKISGLFATHRVPRSRPPCLQNNLKLVEAVGCPIVKRDYAGLIHPGAAEREMANDILKSEGIGQDEPFAVLSPGTSDRREVKRWTDDGFAIVADRFAQETGGRSLVVGISAGCGISGRTRNAIDLNGRTSLPMLAALLERATVFVGVDSGVLHLAAAMETPVVGLYGPSDPEKTGPQGGVFRVVRTGPQCSPCLQTTCDKNRLCMEEMASEEVFSAVQSLLEAPKQASLA